MKTSGWRSSSAYSHVVPDLGAPPMMKSGSRKRLSRDWSGCRRPGFDRRRLLQAERPLDDVQRAAARLLENALQVFAQPADHQQLHTAEHEDGEHDRRPSLHARSEKDLVDEDVHAEHEAERRYGQAEEGDRTYRQRRKGDERVERRLQHVPDRPRRRPDQAPRAMVRHARFVKPAPCDQPEREPVALVALPERVDDRPRNQTEAAGSTLWVGWNCEPPDEPIEHRHRARAYRAVVPAGPGPPDDVLAGLPAVAEVWNQFGGLLPVGRHHDRGVAPAVVDAGGNRHMAAEVAREPERVDAVVVRTDPLQHLERPIAAAVVDEHELPVVFDGQRAHDGGNRFVKRTEVLALVEHGHDDGDERPAGGQWVTISRTATMTRS